MQSRYPYCLITADHIPHALCSFSVNRRIRFDYLNKTHHWDGNQNSYTTETKSTQALLSSCTALHQMPAENKSGPFALSCNFKITYGRDRQWLPSLQFAVSQKRLLIFHRITSEINFYFNPSQLPHCCARLKDVDWEAQLKQKPQHFQDFFPYFLSTIK